LIFTVEGWEDGNGDRHEGTPDDLTDTWGCFVHVSNPQDPEEHHYFWAWALDSFETWDEWYVYIGALMDMYGWALE
jgi:hypothetical protein